MRPRAWPVVAVALVTAGAALAQPRIGADEWLDRLRLAAERAELRGAPPSSGRMAEVRAALGLPVEVLIGEWTVVLPADPVLERLSGGSAADFDLARSRLALLERSVQDSLARDVPAPQRVAAALEDAYRGVIQTRPEPFEAILRSIAEVIGSLVYRLGALVGGAGGALAWLLLIGITLGGLVVLLRRAGLVSDRMLPARSSRAAAYANVDWATKADDAARSGDLREAVRAFYLALVASLADRGLLANAPALTAGEVRSAVRRTRPPLADMVVPATESYERVVYGGDEPDRGDLEALRQAAVLARKT